MKHAFPLVAAALVLSIAGCQCQCGNVIRIVNDSGVGGGSGGGDADGGGGTGGGSATGGGTGTGGGSTVDAGDGTTTTSIGPGTFTLDGGANGSGEGVRLDPNGFVVLNQGASEFHFMWIANDAQGWVSKFDTRTGREVGRYYSVIPKDCANSLGPPCAGGQVTQTRADSTWHPSRTAIDLFGDMWVANRGIGKIGAITKVANDQASCIDRNGNGTIETSRDINGDGQISTNPADGEMIIPTDWADPTKYDECVLFTQTVGGTPGGSGVSGRAIAVAAGIEGSAGDIWVGIHFESRMYKLNSGNGQPMPVSPGGPNFIQLGFGPYGATVDRLQRLWVVQPGVARLALIDTLNGTLVSDNINNTAECASYGIGIDGRNRVWLPGWGLGAVACRYDHSTQTWQRFNFMSASSQTNTTFNMGRGIAIDTAGRVYMSGWGSGQAQLIRFDAETGAIIPFGAAQFVDMSDVQTNGSIGVGLDNDGNPWVNNYSGNATKIDQNTGAIVKTAQQPAGLYTYSDFTGYQLRNFTAPRGTYRRDFEACDDQSSWRTLTWDALVPANTTLQVFMKSANTLADLNSTTLVRYGPFTASPVDLQQAGVPNGKYARVEFVLRSVDGQTTPVLRGFNLTWHCGSGIN